METKLNFSIDANIPKSTSIFDNDDTKLSEAIYTVFPMETEDAELCWGEEKINLSYRYDISTIIQDVIQMIFVLQNNAIGEWSVDWPSGTFAANWVIKWFEDELEINAEWREEFDATEYLKINNVLTVSKKHFLSEWRKITETILVNLTECGYTFENLTDMRILSEARGDDYES